MDIASRRGENICPYDLDITGVTDDGVRMSAILPARERFRRKGPASTPSLFVGAAAIGIRFCIETDADGVGVPHAREPLADIFENVSLATVAAEYTWFNRRQN